LDLIRIVDPELSAKEIRYETPYTVASTAVPLHKVGN
jgi:hypothetical protein